MRDATAAPGAGRGVGWVAPLALALLLIAPASPLVSQQGPLSQQEEPAPPAQEAEERAAEGAEEGGEPVEVGDPEPATAEPPESGAADREAPDPGVEAPDPGVEAPPEPPSPERRSARERSRRHAVDKDTQIHLMSDLRVDEDEVARDAVVILGSLHVLGKVVGDAVSILGPAYIEGEVTGGVTVIGDDVYLSSGSEVRGDVVSVGGSVEREPGAEVRGDVNEIDVGPALHFSNMPWIWRYQGPHFWDVAPLGLAWSVFWTIFRWVLLILLTSFIFLVARDAVEGTATAVRGEPWKAGLLGLATWLLFFPLMIVATIVLALSIIGIPLLIIVWPLGLFALVIACLVGYTATAYAVGGWLTRRFGASSASPYLALLVGVVAIQILSLFAELLGRMGGPLVFFAVMFGLAGWFVRFVAWTAGLGATIMAYTERRRRVRMATLEAAVPPSSAPPPASPAGEPPGETPPIDVPPSGEEGGEPSGSDRRS